jgi:hypothetical protein
MTDSLKGYGSFRFGLSKSSVIKKLIKSETPFDTSYEKKGGLSIKEFMLREKRAVRYIESRSPVIKDYPNEIFMYFNKDNRLYRIENIIKGECKSIDDANLLFTQILKVMTAKLGSGFLIEDNLDAVKFSPLHPPKTLIYRWIKDDGYVTVSLFTGSFYELNDSFIYTGESDGKGYFDVSINYYSSTLAVP